MPRDQLAAGNGRLSELIDGFETDEQRGKTSKKCYFFFKGDEHSLEVAEYAAGVPSQRLKAREKMCLREELREAFVRVANVKDDGEAACDITACR